MAQINIQRLIENIPRNTTIYTPIVEAIVNSIQAIEDTGRKDGRVVVKFVRDEPQASILPDDDSVPPVKAIEIIDNGVGFNSENRESFDTLYGDKKVSVGGKGFGRLTFLQYFKAVGVKSIYKESSASYRSRNFSFTGSQDFIEDETDEEIKENDTKTTVLLTDLREEHVDKLNKRVDTIARHIFEMLLIYFVHENYVCPEIILDDSEDGEVKLNDYLSNHDEIKSIYSDTFTLTKDEASAKFEVKIFKVLYTQNKSAIFLAAHNRTVTKSFLYDYVPEFDDDFYEIVKSSKSGEDVRRNYSIKAYVIGDYLDEHVATERGSFNFSVDTDDPYYPFSKTRIEQEVADIVSKQLGTEIVARQNKKKERVKAYVDEEAPWHKPYLDEFDLSTLPYQIGDTELEGELQKLKFEKEQSAKAKITRILEENELEKVGEEIEKVKKELTLIGKSDLAHYVVSRKVVIDLLSKTLAWDKNHKYQKEKAVHQIIFPMNADSDNISYDDHNLWIIDETLGFSEFVASDQSLNVKDERPDLLIFDKAIAVREGEDLSNPITIFEFKRPQRKEYAKDEDPFLQIFKYVEKIRKGNFQKPNGRNVKANQNTPAYGYLICDITDKIKEFCTQYSLSMSPDEEGYFGYHAGYRVYIQVISFDKLVSDADQRNKMFFKKLGIQ
jgi:hypothetical protein